MYLKDMLYWERAFVLTAVGFAFVGNVVLLFSLLTLKQFSSCEKLISLSTFLLTSIQNWLVAKREHLWGKK